MNRAQRRKLGIKKKPYLEKKIGRKFEKVLIPNGQEICEKQLFSLIDNIKETEIANSHIDGFLPQIFEMFSTIDISSFLGSQGMDPYAVNSGSLSES